MVVFPVFLVGIGWRSYLSGLGNRLETPVLSAEWTKESCLRAFIKPPASNMMSLQTRFSWEVGAWLLGRIGGAPKTPTFFDGRTIATRCLRQLAFLGLDGRLVRIVDYEVRHLRAQVIC